MLFKIYIHSTSNTRIICEYIVWQERDCNLIITKTGQSPEIYLCMKLSEIFAREYISVTLSIGKN